MNNNITHLGSLSSLINTFREVFLAKARVTLIHVEDEIFNKLGIVVRINNIALIKRKSTDEYYIYDIEIIFESEEDKLAYLIAYED